MSKDTKKRALEFTSPRGVFVYPSLDKPDFGTKAFPKPDGDYKVTLKLPEADAEKFISEKLGGLIEEAREEASRAFKELPIAQRKKLKEVTFNDVGAPEYDKETEEPTGYVLIKIAMRAGGVRKDKSTWNQRPAVFDARGVALKKVPEIWGGSEGRLSFTANPYFIPGTGAAGVSLRLKAAQVIKLVQGGQRDAGGFGFAPEDDGFDSSEFEAAGDDAVSDAAVPADTAGDEDF